MAKRRPQEVCEKATVIRYKGAVAIRQMINNDQMIEAFVHTQMGIEILLWDKIVEIFKDRKASEVRTAIEKSNKGKDKTATSTYELMKWAHFLGALNDQDYGHLIDFNAKRNDLIHGHGKWWSAENYKEALQHGVRFLEQNKF
jgi:hypothetical protein